MTEGPNSGDDPLDVIIVGAGLSGVGCGCYLRRQLPDKRFAILEARGDLGGTWDLFRYPGIRSDSDLFTFGYDFKPWLNDRAIADGAAIKAYIREAAVENGVDRAICYHHAVRGASWDSATALWTVDVERLDTGERVRLRGRWLFCAAGYYDYDQGFRPHFPGEEGFRGRLIHPQHWPEDLDYAGKRVAVIGSGATAVTLVPAMAHTAAHVTQVQRTPTYVLPLPSRDRLNQHLRRLLPEEAAYAITRYKNVLRQRWIYVLFQRFPKASRRLIRWANRKALPEGYPVDHHFNPPYDPWDQRLCAVPDGDYFKALRSGSASIVTGTIERFSERGIRMTTGEEIEADIVVTATGLNLRMFGGADLVVDGRRVTVSERLVFKGMMLDGVPNFSFAIGYTNASWTLKVGLLCQYFCRLLERMDAKRYASVEARRPQRPIATRPLIDFGAGYVRRALETLPRQGEGAPWEMTFNYIEDARQLRRGPVEHPDLHFATTPRSEPARSAA